MNADDAHAKDWNALAGLDPLWAICSVPRRKGRGWDLDAFFTTGEAEVAAVLAYPEAQPARFQTALDFGCGVGRVARALADRFETCYGLDISEKMVEQARALNADRPNCTFSADPRGLARVETRSMDFVYSTLVLQHLRSKRDVFETISELVRVVRADGAAVFQLPQTLPLRRRLQLRRRTYRALRQLGISDSWLYNRLQLHPISLIGIAPDEVEAAVARSDATVTRAEAVDPADVVAGIRYFVRR